MTDDTLIAYGGAVKALGDGKIGGYLVAFTGPDEPDLVGDYFTKETDFDIETGDRTTVYYNHGYDPILKNRKIGKGTLTISDAGVWMEAQLQMRDEYERAIYRMAEKEKLGLSSGSLAHLVQTQPNEKAQWITAWPLGKDASLTPTPAAGPILTAVQPLKTWAATVQPLEVAEQGAGDAPDATAETKTQPDQSTLSFGEITMTTDQTAVGRDEFEALKGASDSMSERLDKLLAMMVDSAPLKNAGYLAPDSETDHADVKSLGDFLIAVRNGNAKRLTQVYGAMKDVDGTGGASGGYLLPTQFSAQLLEFTPADNPILSLVQRIPVTARSGSYPVLDQFITPTAGSGNVAWAAGVNSATVAESVSTAEVQPGFEELNWHVHDIGGYVEVSNSLMEDSPISIESLLTRLFRVSINHKLERHVLRGSGTGEPLGILNSAAAVAVTTAGDNVFAEADALAMLARFNPVGGNPVWIMHRSVIPDLGAFSDTTSAAVDWRSGVAQTLLGYPIRYSEHMPQANGDDVMLADLSGYLLFERKGLTVRFSEHAAFLTRKGTWDFLIRCDGMPWLRSAVTLADPTGSYTVSPFVFHDD